MTDHVHEYTEDDVVIADMGRRVIIRCACDHEVELPASLVVRIADVLRTALA